MRDDIPTLLRDAVADPSYTPDFDAMATRGRRQHVAARAATALVAVAALVAGGLVLWPDGQPARGPVIGGDASPADTSEPDTGPTIPEGWLEIRVGDAALKVPGDWTIETFSEPAGVCPNTATQPTAFVLEQGPVPDRSCDLMRGLAFTVQVAPLSTVPEKASRWPTYTTERGVAGERLASEQETVVTYRFADLDLWVQFAGPEPLGDLDDRILSTLARIGETTSEPIEGSLASPRPVPDDPDPVVRAGAAGTKVDCDGAVHLGGWALDAGGPAVGTADPRAALEAFLDEELFGYGLPDNGYDQVASEPGRVLFTYQVDGRPKVAVIVADGTVLEEEVNTPDGWGFEVFATCDPAEYAPTADVGLDQTVWTDHDGNRVPTSTITSMPGPEHCDWQTVTFLQLNGQQYLRDPEQRLSDSTVQPYDGDAQLPADATDTGYRLGDNELWLAADGTIAYLLTDDGVEAWPSTTDMVGCR